MLKLSEMTPLGRVVRQHDWAGLGTATPAEGKRASLGLRGNVWWSSSGGSSQRY